MGSTTTQHKTKYRATIVGARNLVTAVMASARKTLGAAGEKLFGISNPFRTNFQGEAVIPDSNVAQFLKDRIDKFGIAGVKLPATVASLSDAIVDIARQLAKETKKIGGLNEQQVQRIAVEYVTQSTCIPLSSVESFSTYLQRSAQFRTAVKAVNKTAQASTAEAFSQGSDLGTIERLLEQGRQAWANMQRHLAESPHLAALRTQFNAPMLFTSMEGWQAVKVVNPDVRLAVLNELRCIMQTQGSPYVTTANVEQAIARVKGNEILTGGNAFGVTTSTAIEAMASSRMTGVQPNGGTQVGFDGTPAWQIGAALRDLNGHVSGTAKLKSDGTIDYAINVTEGTSPKAPFTAPIALVAARAAAPQQYA
ncbi:MAG: hypothetical protein Q7S02_02210 [bacterium]|nr:hypothetical protein [bacterium]